MKEFIDYKKSHYDYFSKILTEKMGNDEPFFVGRIGGGDYKTILDYYSNRSLIKNKKWIKKKYNHVREFNGYFDKEEKTENFNQYLNILLDGYRTSDIILVSNKDELDKFRNNKLKKNENFYNDILNNKLVFNYAYIEGITPFLKSFSSFAENKKILIISPFSESIKHQYQKKDKIIKNYKYPNFILLTYDTPITYNNSKDDLDQIVQTKNWIEQCELMSNEISKIDFDIALLSCASYSMYLGNFIKNKLNKKAIYIGGVMNVLFNIYGKRYDNLYYNSIIDKRYQIKAIEKNKYQHVKGGRKFRTESFNAYF